MTLSVTIDLPDRLVHQLEERAHNQQQTIADLLRDLVLQNWQPPPRLPEAAEAELTAMSSLSDEVLWILARNTMSKEQQDDLAMLNQQAKQRALLPKEEARHETLLQQYDRAMVRRAQAAPLLHVLPVGITDKGDGWAKLSCRSLRAPTPLATFIGRTHPEDRI